MDELNKFHKIFSETEKGSGELVVPQEYMKAMALIGKPLSAAQTRSIMVK